MKQKTMVLLALAVLIACIMGTGYAQQEQGAAEDVYIEERLEYTTKARVDLIINGRTAEISGILAATSSQYRCELTLTLRKYENGNWDKEIDSWSASGSGLVGASIDTQKTGLASGKYRVDLSGKIYDANNRLVEAVSRHSAQKTVS